MIFQLRLTRLCCARTRAVGHHFSFDSFEHTVRYSLSEALVLSHEDAPPPLWEPYLAHLFRPIKPLVLFGRDASLQPRTPVGNCTWFGWKDSKWTNDGSEIHTMSISISISISMSTSICICIGIGVYISMHIRTVRFIFC